MPKLNLYGCVIGRSLEALTLAKNKREAKRIMVGDEIDQVPRCDKIVDYGKPSKRPRGYRAGTVFKG